MHKHPTTRWIVRDLSNGDAYIAVPKTLMTTYIWVFETRREARTKRAEHKRNRDFAALDIEEKRNIAWVEKYYDCLGDDPEASAEAKNYWKLKFPSRFGAR